MQSHLNNLITVVIAIGVVIGSFQVLRVVIGGVIAFMRSLLTAIVFFGITYMVLYAAGLLSG